MLIDFHALSNHFSYTKAGRSGVRDKERNDGCN